MKKTILTPTTLTAIAICIIGLVLNIGIKIFLDDLYGILMAGTIFIETIVLGVFGTLFLLHKELRPIAQGILIGLGINLVIGFSVCTMISKPFIPNQENHNK
jgi:hypothetical protein